jgi:acyl carrier protein
MPTSDASEPDLTELEEELKELIVDGLVLEEVTPEDIDADEPLFGTGVGLDSVDALELVMLLQKEYGINISNPEEETKEQFESIRTLAKFVHQKTKE